MITDTQHARELARRAKAFEARLDATFSRSFCYVSLSLADDAKPYRVSVNADRLGAVSGLPGFKFAETFDSFADGLTAAEAAFDAHLAAHDLTVRRKMALAIIDLVDAEGSVTDRSLRLAGFTQPQIDAQHEAASELAHEMASKGPFTVILEGAGNHVEAA